MHRRRLIRLLKQIGMAVVTVVVIAVIVFTVMAKSKPTWVGTTEAHEMTRSTCATPDSIQLHGKWWASKTAAPKDWQENEYYAGKVKYTSSSEATFTTTKGVVLKLRVSSDSEANC